MSKSRELLDRLAETGAGAYGRSSGLARRGDADSGALGGKHSACKARVAGRVTEAKRPSRQHQPSWSAAQWRARHCESLRYWSGFHPAEEAAVIAWSEMIDLWHKQFGAREGSGICGGCRRPTERSAVLRMGDGTSVHIATLDCLIAYGERWRNASSQALVAMGVTPPATETSLGPGEVP